MTLNLLFFICSKLVIITLKSFLSLNWLDVHALQEKVVSRVYILRVLASVACVREADRSGLRGPFIMWSFDFLTTTQGTFLHFLVINRYRVLVYQYYYPSRRHKTTYRYIIAFPPADAPRPPSACKALLSFRVPCLQARNPTSTLIPSIATY